MIRKLNLIITILLISVFQLSVSAGTNNVCDSLIIESVHIAPFSDSLIEIIVTNHSNDIFSYPGFILFNENGDTLAKEEVNYYGIGQSQSSHLTIMNGVTLPTDSFHATIELWTGFYSELACSFSMMVHICPSETCHTVYPFFTSYDSIKTIGSFQYNVYNMLGQLITQSGFVLDSAVQSFEDTICLPSGKFVLEISQQSGIIEGQSFFGIQTLPYTFINYPWKIYHNDGTGNQLLFPLFNKCVTTSEIITDNQPVPEYLITSGHGILGIKTSGQDNIGKIELFNMLGMNILHLNSQKNFEEIPISKLSPGIYLIRIQNHNTLRFTRKIMIG